MSITAARTKADVCRGGREERWYRWVTSSTCHTDDHDATDKKIQVCAGCKHSWIPGLKGDWQVVG